jgi:hypothetical protein
MRTVQCAYYLLFSIVKGAYRSFRYVYISAQIDIVDTEQLCHCHAECGSQLSYYICIVLWSSTIMKFS